MTLTPSEQAVLDAYKAEAANKGRRKALCLTKRELAAITGFSDTQCCDARRALIARKVLRKMGFSVPMKVELL